MPVPRIEYDLVKRKLLVFFYHSLVSDGQIWVNPKEAAEIIGTANNISSICMRMLKDEKLLTEGTRRVQINNTYGLGNIAPEYETQNTGNFGITAAGREYIEKLNDAIYDETLSLIYSDENEEISTAVEPIDNEWKPLAIDRQREDYKNMISATEAALTDIEQNNGYAATDSNERDSIVLTIRGTLESVKNSTPGLDFIVSGLLQPLKFIAKKFSEASMGELAKVAIKMISIWLGLDH